MRLNRNFRLIRDHGPYGFHYWTVTDQFARRDALGRNFPDRNHHQWLLVLCTPACGAAAYVSEQAIRKCLPQVPAFRERPPGEPEQDPLPYDEGESA